MAIAIIDQRPGPEPKGLNLLDPIEGVPASERANAEAQLRRAAGSHGGGGPLIAALNKAFAYDRLQDAISKYRTFSKGNPYDQNTFGRWTKDLLQKGDFRGPDGADIPQSKYESHAQNTHPAVKAAFTAALNANLSSADPLPVFFFIGTSGMKKAEDKELNQDGFRLVKTRATGLTPNEDRTHLVLGILCATDSTM